MMIAFKLYEKHTDGYGPLFVDKKMRFQLGQIVEARCGEKIDDTHVKSSLGALHFSPGFHLSTVPDSPWIGKRNKETGKLIRRKKHVWVVCLVLGDEIITNERLSYLPNGWYRCKTNTRQKDPWIITRYMIPLYELSNDEVVKICAKHGIVAQEVEE